MQSTISEVLDFVAENDVKFIRLGFCDPFGMQKNISIMADELPGAFRGGVSFDASAVQGFRDVTDSDLLLFPDPATLTVLPWRPGPGRVVRFYCDIKNPDGSQFLHDSRYLLRQAVTKAEETGLTCQIGAECEFYLFQTDETGEPTEIPYDRGGYLDITPLDKGENIRREICLCLEEMGLSPEASHHEQGPGQNEIDFKPADPLRCADNILTFKSVVKAIAARNGVFASFMPKPVANAPGSGMHINLSLGKNGFNIFKNPREGHSPAAESFIAGILNRAPEMTLFLNPLTNSYARFGEFEAPRYVSWSHQNRSQLVRIPAATGEKARMELRSPDPALNPYLAFALLLSAGFEGIESGLALPPQLDADLYTAEEHVKDSLTALPGSLEAAVALAGESAFVKQAIGESLLAKYTAVKGKEAQAFKQAGNAQGFYREQYFYFV